MAFLSFEDMVKSVYQDQHKSKPINLTSVEEGKNLRIQKQAKERRSRRIDTFITNRVIEDDNDSFPSTPNLEGKAPKQEGPSDLRKRQMLQWKQERMQRKKLEPKKPPPFKVGVMKHAIAPFQEEIFQNCKHTMKVPQASNQRVTRATTRANTKAVQQATHSYKTQVPQKSFAPANAMFHPPKVTIVERQKPKLKYTPRKPKRDNSARVFTANLFESTSSLKTTKKSPVKTKTNVAIKCKNTVIGNVAIKNKQALFRATRSKAVDLDESFKTKVESPINSPQGRRTPINISKTSESGASKTSESGGDVFSSPDPANSSSDLVITSPFVTVGRGKASRQQESMVKIKFGYSQMSPEKSAQCFRMQLDREVTRLSELCTTWRTYEQEHGSELMEDSTDLISLAIGQTQLLINKKFEQFRGLIVQCENKERREGEGVVTVQDLQGFWDMVYMQVENVDIRFNRLVELKGKNWQEDEVAPQVAKAKKKAAGKSKADSTKSSSGLKAMILAARMKSKVATPMAEASLMSHLAPKNTITFNGGFFSVTSPVKSLNEEELVRTPSKRMSMLKTVIASEAKKRLSTKALRGQVGLPLGSLSAQISEMKSASAQLKVGRDSFLRTPPSAAAILRASCLSRNIGTKKNYNVEAESKPDYLVSQVDLNKTPGKSILKTPGTNKKSNTQNSKKTVKVLFTEASSDEDQENKTKSRSTKRHSNTKSSEDGKENGTGKEMEEIIVQANGIDEEMEEIHLPTPAKRSRRSRQNDENQLPPIDMEVSSSTKRKTPKRSKKCDVAEKEVGEVAIGNLIDLGQPTPLLKPARSRRTRLTQEFSQLSAHNTRYALRRMSTNTPD